MSMLKRRPEVWFDASNSEHREHFHKFRSQNTWQGAPRFILEEQFTNVPDMLQSKMLDYYMKTEFRKK